MHTHHVPYPKHAIWHQRAAITKQIRAFFGDSGFLEVDTPIALAAPALEAYIDVPELHLQTQEGLVRRFLQSSPELAMKRLLAQGLCKIFQIAPVFRTGDDTPLHTPEFRMLEWYRAHASWQEIANDCLKLLEKIAYTYHPTGSIPYKTQSIPINAPQWISVDQLFQRHAHFSILEYASRDALFTRVQALGLSAESNDSWNDLYHRIWLNCIEPMLAQEPILWVVHDFPAPLASLARLSKHDTRIAERFEIYVAGMELANGFGELTDASLQRERFLQEHQRRISLGECSYPMPEQFLFELKNMPPASGIAVGLERLLMLMMNIQDVHGVAFVPWKYA